MCTTYTFLTSHYSTSVQPAETHWTQTFAHKYKSPVWPKFCNVYNVMFYIFILFYLFIFNICKKNSTSDAPIQKS